MKVLVVTNMYPTAESPAFGPFVKDQVDSLRRARVDIDVLFINGRKNRLNYLWGIFRLWWVLLKKRYDIIHAHYAISGFVARLQWFHPVIVTYHGAEVGDYAPFWLKTPARRGAWLFDRIIVVNKREKERLINGENKTTIIPGGIDFSVFCPMPVKMARRQLDLPLEKPLVLWAGEYWQYEKRFELVQEVVDRLKQNLPETELVLVSGKPHAIMPFYMNACDVLLLTSRSEGSPTVVKEAMACNLPIVSTDVGDVAEIISGVENCYLVEPEAEEVANTLRKVLELRPRTRGREKIKHLGADQIAQRVIEIYNELCSPEHKIDLLVDGD